MKYLLLFILSFLCSCHATVDDWPDYVYYFKNESEHSIFIEMTDIDKSFPSELTLQAGETYTWMNPMGGLFAPFHPETFTITFDGTYTIDFRYFADDRNPFYQENYVIVKQKHKQPTATYTFTERDYEIAKAMIK